MLAIISNAMRAHLKPIIMHSFFKRIKRPLFLSGSALLTILMFWIGMLPNDYEQGSVFKIMYVHVPASWWALGIYVIMSVQAICGFVFRLPQCHLMAKNWAISGLLMTILSLITGMIWGKFTWGAYWVWDARLTTMFIQ
ncbi:MAG: cytochrome c biogenesis protein CcsA, partial [Alphaproteobacteria bacterium]|nr:cytochrome c biogenesis protein CcsA [Alphaproteobacteria bacterium]